VIFLSSSHPEGSRLERKKEQTKNKIIETAVKLFTDQGFDSITMEEIAQKVDIARKTLYNYFPMKEAILNEYVQRLMKAEEVGLKDYMKDLPDTRTRLMAGFLEGAKWVRANRDIYKVYVQYRFQTVLSAKAQSSRSGYQDLLMKVLKAGQEQGEIRTDILLDQLAQQLEFFFTVPIMMWLTQPEFPLEQALENNIKLFIDGAKAGY
jgi:AcrR family transcriptional regulator